MILTCPECQTRYLADSAGFMPSGRTVRCSNCEHTWFQPGPDDTPKHATVEEVETQLVSGGATSEMVAGTRRGMGARLGVAAGGVVILAFVGLLIGGFVYRNDVVKRWPYAKEVYAVLHVPVVTDPMTFINFREFREVENSTVSLGVEGEIKNNTDQPMKVPDVLISLLDDEGAVLDRWQYAPGEVVLSPGERHEFRTKRENPPAKASRLKLEFASNPEPDAAAANSPTTPEH